MKASSGTFLALWLVLGSSVGPSSALAAVIYWDPWSPGSFGSIASSPNTWKSPLDRTGTNQYSGATAVEAGMLSISVAYLADAAAVTVSTNATLNLDFNGSDAIHALFFGEEQTVAGVWGGLTSSAPNKSERLTGPGTLTVLTGVEPPGILVIIR